MKVLLAIKSKKPAVIEITGEGSATYIWFNRGAKFARTITRSTWPILNIDLDRNDHVIGIEAVDYKGFSIEQLLAKAGVAAPRSLLRRASHPFRSRKCET